MSVFVRVKLAPKDLKDGEFTVYDPDFYPEIVACKAKKPSNGLLTVNYLREIIALAGSKYIGESFNALTDLNISLLKGVPSDSDFKTNNILVDLFKQQYPAMLEKHIEHQLKSRPSGTKLIYFIGESELSTVFIKNGIDEVLEKDLKEKQIVGKPAITNEEAALLKTAETSPASVIAEQLSNESKTKKPKKKSEEVVV